MSTIINCSMHNQHYNVNHYQLLNAQWTINITCQPLSIAQCTMNNKHYMSTIINCSMHNQHYLSTVINITCQPLSALHVNRYQHYMSTIINWSMHNQHYNVNHYQLLNAQWTINITCQPLSIAQCTINNKHYVSTIINCSMHNPPQRNVKLCVYIKLYITCTGYHEETKMSKK